MVIDTQVTRPEKMVHRAWEAIQRPDLIGKGATPLVSLYSFRLVTRTVFNGVGAVIRRRQLSV